MPSRLMTIYIVVIHVFTGICILSFDIPTTLCAVGVIILLASFLWCLKQWVFQPQSLIKYEYIYKRWSVSDDVQQWQYYESVNVVYLNDTFVWIILSSPGIPSQAKLIGVDSMEDERFLQLRRCILCPEMFGR